ncbi:glycosyltransferase [Sphaerisporangium fuscum]|uniref:glycosyltransferase n=1 Tax=Sphaerisporangium fuscum TaxID=2835868 RepID=UPI001BDC5468|nr:glycosyltransferase [Sphaerisporangium fuscum]
MRVCIVGKYPPIEGGVSSSTYWLARGLAARGHEVHVVTNADEVDDRYRITLGPRDAPLMQPEFPGTGGRVRVHGVESFARRAMAHIPVADPYVTRLSSLATDVVRRHGCEVVLAYYFEPYGVAGWLASRWTGRPLIVKHAGSDLDRLAGVPGLATAYKEVLRSADAVVTRRHLVRRFAGMGVPPGRIVLDPPYALAPAFHPGAEPLDVDAVALRDGEGNRPRPFDPAVPAIGVYGKVGETKGTFDLVRALGRLAAEGRSFTFLAMVGGPMGELLAPALRDAGLAKRTIILPYLPNWRVPSFIRACTAVCFLERDFPVAIHGPVVAREVMACGTCLVLSGEIADKQGHGDGPRPGENPLVVGDPKDGDALTAALRWVVDDPEGARRLGAAGAQTGGGTPGDFEAYVAAWEDLLRHHARPKAAADGPAAPGDVEDVLGLVAPSLLRYVRASWPSAVEEFAATGPATDPASCGLRFCAFLAGRLASGPLAGYAPVVRDALRYQAARIHASHDMPDAPPPYAVVDRLGGRPVGGDADGLYPVRAVTAWAERFEHDVAALFPVWADPAGRSPADGEAFRSVTARPMLVLFQRLPNLIPRELEIDERTLELLSRCDGSLTTGEVVAATASDAGPEARAAVLAALDRLYRLGVIVFGETDPVLGWRKGARSDPAALPPLLRSPLG